MQIFFYVAFLLVVGIAIFAVQNSGASPVVIKFLTWKFETSLVYSMLGSIVLGILLTLVFWIPLSIRTFFRKYKTKGEISSTKSQSSG